MLGEVVRGKGVCWERWYGGKGCAGRGGKGERGVLGEVVRGKGCAGRGGKGERGVLGEVVRGKGVCWERW